MRTAAPEFLLRLPALVLRQVGGRLYSGVTSAVAGVIGVASPLRASRYREHRLLYHRTYAAGEGDGPNQRWRPRKGSADADIARAQRLLLPRVRDLSQNSSYISGAIERIINNVVRGGIFPQARFRTKSGAMDDQRNRAAELLWGNWTRVADITGIDSFAAIQKLVLRHVWIDGEVLVHRVYDNSIPEVPPLRLEVLECDHLDCSVDGEIAPGRIARRGIEFDAATGRPVTYHILPIHPGDNVISSRPSTARRIPAADIIHVYYKRRASQTRGISWLVAIVMESFDLSEYKTYERIGARLAAAFGIFLKNTFPDMAGMGVPAGGGPGATTVSEVSDYIEPGRIQQLPAGMELQIASHNRPGTQFEPYIRDSVRSMSVGTNMSYESFSNDYTAASYSSARSASLEERLSYQGQQQFLGERVNRHVWAWFLEAAVIGGQLDLPGYSRRPLPWHWAVVWQNPGWTWVDPLKDSRAAAEGIDLSTTTRSRIAAAQGEDWEETLEQLIVEEEKLTRLYEMRRKNKALGNSVPELPKEDDNAKAAD